MLVPRSVNPEPPSFHAQGSSGPSWHARTWSVPVSMAWALAFPVGVDGLGFGGLGFGGLGFGGFRVWGFRGLGV